MAFFWGGARRGHVISQHITAGEGRDQPDVSIAHPKDPSFSAWISIIFLLCVLFSSGFSLRHFNFGAMSLGFLIGTVRFPSSSGGLFVWPLLGPPQTCPPLSRSHRPCSQDGGWRGLAVLPGTGLLSASLDLASPRTQGKRTKWSQLEKQPRLRAWPKQRGRSSRLKARAVQLLFSFVF